MIRGIQKNVILLKTPKNHYFESAYFVLRYDLSTREQKENDMIREANRIISESSFSIIGSKKHSEHTVRERKRSRSYCFCLGGALGAFLTSAVFFIIKLLS